MEKQELKLEIRCTEKFESWIGEQLTLPPEHKFPDLVRTSLLLVTPMVSSKPWLKESAA